MFFHMYSITIVLSSTALICNSQQIKALSSMLSNRMQCDLLLFGLENDFVKNFKDEIENYLYLNQQSTQPSFIIGTSSLKEILHQLNSNCFIGISKINKIGEMQNMLLQTYQRQLIVIDDINSSLTRDNVAIHKHHHPIVVLSNDKNGHTIQKVICKRNKHIVLNKFTNSWAMPIKIDPMDLERKCNDGRHPLSGKTLSASVFNDRPFLDADHSSNEIMGGVIPDLLKLISRKHGFSYEVTLADNWFLFHPNGTIGGSLGNVVRQKVDLDLGQAHRSAHQFGQITTFTYFVDFGYFERSPKQLSLYLNIAYTLDIYTWALSIAAMFSVFLVLWLIIHLEKDYQLKTNLRTLEMVYGIFFQEYQMGKKADARKLSTQLRFTWVITSMFITMALSGNLKSVLVMSRHEKRTLTLNEMIDKDMTVHLSSTMASYLDAGFSKSELNSRILCQARKKNSITPLNSANAIRDMYQPVLDHGGASPVIEQGIAVAQNDFMKSGRNFAIVRIPERYMSLAHSMVFERYDPRAQYFNPVISTAREAGLIEFYFSKWMPPKNMKQPEEINEQSLIMDHFMLPCVISLFGLMISCAFFLTECTVYSYTLTSKLFTC